MTFKFVVSVIKELYAETRIIARRDDKVKKIHFNGLYFLILYAATYYGWIIYWKNTPEILTLGGNILSISGSLVAAIWLAKGAANHSNKVKRNFTILLFLGCMSYVVAELVWAVYENILKIEVPFPGYPDLFYLLQLLFFLAAFVYLIGKGKKKFQFIKFLFDVAIIMTVATTFSWHFLISPIVQFSDGITFSFWVSLAYPLGDLALLFGALSIFFGMQKTFSAKESGFIISGLLIQIFADSSYLYLIALDQYTSGSLIDPLFIVGILCVGYTGILKKVEVEENQTGKAESVQIEKLDAMRLFLPYLNVTILFIFMFNKGTGNYAVSIGLGISILLVVVRQIIMIIENHHLLREYSQKADELEISEERYRSLFEYHPDAVYSLDLKGKFESINSAGAKLFGYEKKELVGLSSVSFTSEVHQRTVTDHLLKATKGSTENYEIPIFNKNGDFHQLNVTNIPIIVKNHLVGMFGIGKDITENKKNEEKIKYLAYHDSLTGLPNRAFFEEILNKFIADAQQNNKMFGVMFMDLDRFKMINDTLGHDVGDQLLVAVANRLKECIKETDTAARQGGDEFILLIEEVSRKEEITGMAQLILDCFKQPFTINGIEILSTPSIGIAIYPIDGHSSAALIKKADLAMYDVKENGRGYFALFDDANTNFSKKLVLEKDMDTALSRKELFLLYQPQLNAANKEIVGVEALIRWNHPSLGIIPPLEFIPIAEKTGKILSIGEWVLKEACLQAKMWKEKGYHLKIGVNLSPYQLKQEDIVERIAAILSETKVDPRSIVLEITEAATMDDIKKIFPKLTALRQLGVKVSIDDFGTGYSSLSYLANFPIDEIKIAREFIANIENDEMNQIIVTSMIELANKLKLNIIAEGIERESQALFLQNIHCAELQGYLFGEPMSMQQILLTVGHPKTSPREQESQKL